MEKIQKTLEGFLDSFTTQPIPKNTHQNLGNISHRELIIYLLQFGIPFTEKTLFRALKNEIFVQRAKGHLVSPINYAGMQRQLRQLAQKGIVEQIGYCWRLRA
ncbi:MAG: hypothetical protein ACFFCZ_18840 [Promethearchaeota archaeon]